MIGINPAKPITAAKISHQLIPAKNTTNKPDALTKIDVPKSGCIATSKVGIIIIAIAINVSLNLGGSGRLPKYTATINGTASFTISDG